MKAARQEPITIPLVRLIRRVGGVITSVKKMINEGDEPAEVEMRDSKSIEADLRFLGVRPPYREPKTRRVSNEDGSLKSDSD